jgi:ligand-binding sensor domain-containing protein
LLWFGTGFSATGGLTRYDGRRWQSFDRDDGLAGPKVRYLFQDQAGVLWVGSETSGIVRMAGEQWPVYSPKNGLAGWEVLAMLQDSEQNVWLGTEAGLTRVDAQAWRDLLH